MGSRSSDEFQEFPKNIFILECMRTHIVQFKYKNWIMLGHFKNLEGAMEPIFKFCV